MRYILTRKLSPHTAEATIFNFKRWKFVNCNRQLFSAWLVAVIDNFRLAARGRKRQNIREREFREQRESVWQHEYSANTYTIHTPFRYIACQGWANIVIAALSVVNIFWMFLLMVRFFRLMIPRYLVYKRITKSRTFFRATLNIRMCAYWQ